MNRNRHERNYSGFMSCLTSLLALRKLPWLVWAFSALSYKNLEGLGAFALTQGAVSEAGGVAKE